MEKAAQMLGAGGRQPHQGMGAMVQQPLPVELQEDLFNAMSDTGMYDIYSDSLVYSDSDKFNMAGMGEFMGGRGGAFLSQQEAMMSHEQQHQQQQHQQQHQAMLQQVQVHAQTQQQGHQQPRGASGMAPPPMHDPVPPLAMFNAQQQQQQQQQSAPSFAAPPTAIPPSRTAADAIKAAASSAAAEAATAAAEIRSRRLSAVASMSNGGGGGTSASTAASTDSPTALGGRRRSSKSLAAAGSNSPGDTPGRGGNKGLRHFSLKVCEKVEQKGRTTYNEVADELVEEFRSAGDCGATPTGQYDEKNIRRRVYDALNVLMAMEIIQKEKKDIMWRGLPSTGHEEVRQLREKKAAKAKEIDAKHAHLQELVEQHRALTQLMDRNAPNPVREKVHGILHLPFVLIQTERDATVEVFISDDMQNVQLDFGKSPFQIHDDGFLLKQMSNGGNLPNGSTQQQQQRQLQRHQQMK